MSTTIIKSFGFIVNINNDDLITNLNELLNIDYKYCPIVFYQTLQRTKVFPRFCQLQLQSVWDFEHTLISTNILTTQVLNNCSRAKRKLFYVKELEWLSLPELNYAQLVDIYQNPEIDLIANNEKDFDILTKLWKKPINTINNYNYKQLKETINGIQ